MDLDGSNYADRHLRIDRLAHDRSNDGAIVWRCWNMTNARVEVLGALALQNSDVSCKRTHEGGDAFSRCPHTFDALVCSFMLEHLNLRLLMHLYLLHAAADLHRYDRS
jgi:hypothetical protein